jgi:hypothetical protein
MILNKNHHLNQQTNSSASVKSFNMFNGISFDAKICLKVEKQRNNNKTIITRP